MSRERVLPALRSLDVTPIEHDGATVFLLRDASRVAPRALALSAAGCFIAAHFDGANTYVDVQQAFVRRFGQSLAAEDIEALVTALDESLMLHTPRFERARAEFVADYEAGDVRDGRDRWPDARRLRVEVNELLEGEGRRVAGVCGVVAPHLDYGRGHPCYGETYRLLRASGLAERYVILGTNHFGRSACVVLTRKDFLTPLGRVPTDRSFIAALERELGESLCRNEFDHRNEHSVELQVHLLQVLHGGRPFRIVPVLCPDPCGPTGTAPHDGDGPDLGDFADALAYVLRETREPTIVIAGADLSHVGRHFGDAERATPESLERIGRYDRRLLELLARRAEEQFLDEVRAVGNRTHICSVGNLYALRRALPDARCDILSYHQALNGDADMHVSCASAVLYR